ncbi:MAG: protein kinase [Leptolyngbya sp.]|nr:protein kinase [Candidatus Melainabacteria bacterium]
MGNVYKYHNANLDKFFAIKMLATTNFSDSAYKRFVMEGRAASRLKHNNLLTVHDLGLTEDHQPYMVMDFFEGTTLADILRQGVKLNDAEILEIFIQSCDGMAYAHENGIIHRDLKPNNILISGIETKNLHVAIFDFGISKVLDDTSFDVTKVGEVFGSPLYMSPEQWGSAPLDARSDIYSLGCTFYELLTGAAPFTSQSVYELAHKHTTEKPMDIKEASMGRHYPPAITDAVYRMLEKDPALRPSSMTEVKALLTRIDVLPASQPQSSQALAGKNSEVLKTYLFSALAIVSIAVIAFVVYSSLYQPTSHDAYVGQAQRPDKQTTAPPVAPLASIDPPKITAQQIAAVAKKKEGDDMPMFMRQIGNNLTAIDLNGYAIRDSNLVELKRDAFLRRLRISETSIGDAGLRIIGKLPNLDTLHADHTALTNDGLKYLEKLPLKELSVSRNNLDATGLKKIAKIQSITDLSIPENPVRDSDLKHLAPLKKIKYLHLDKTQITDEGVKTVVEMFPELEEFHARNIDSVTGKSLKYLAKAPKLRRLTLSGCKIPALELREFFATNKKVEDIRNHIETMMLDFTDVR